jgi:hypothetical protein
MQKEFHQQNLVGAIEGLLTFVCIVLVAMAGVGMFAAPVAVA